MPFRRRNAGKGHYYTDEDGSKLDGVTTLLGNGFPKPALINWAANATADYAIDHWESLSSDAVSERAKKLRKARFADRDAAAKRGTEVHKLAEGLIRGEEVEVPDELAGHVESYVSFLDKWQPEAVLVEAPVANRRWRYAGTVDAVIRVPDGRVYLMDIKTSRSGIFPETAYQLAAYTHAEVYLGDDGDEHPVSELGITGAYGVWVRADGVDVYPVDVSEKTHKSFLHIAYVAREAQDNRELIGDAIERPPEVIA